MLSCARLDAMPKRPCFICGITARFLKEVSNNSDVDYYRCDRCGAVWTLDRADPNKPPFIVYAPDDGPAKKSRSEG